MKKNLFVLGIASVFALTGCHGISKCSFEEFKEAASKAVENAPKVDEIIWKGNLDGDKFNISSKTSVADLSLKELAIKTFLLTFDSVAWAYQAEVKDATYYKGLGFKVVEGDDKYEWNSKGYLAKISVKDDGKAYTVNVTHKYSK